MTRKAMKRNALKPDSLNHLLNPSHNPPSYLNRERHRESNARIPIAVSTRTTAVYIQNSVLNVVLKLMHGTAIT